VMKYLLERYCVLSTLIMMILIFGRAIPLWVGTIRVCKSAYYREWLYWWSNSTKNLSIM